MSILKAYESLANKAFFTEEDIKDKSLRNHLKLNQHDLRSYLSKEFSNDFVNKVDIQACADLQACTDMMTVANF